MAVSTEESPAGSGFAYTVVVLAAVPLLFAAISNFISPKFDAQEPPPLWPTIPLVGHIIRLLRERASFYISLFEAKKLPICSLPMLNGKLYVINSPALIDKAMKNPDISFQPFVHNFTLKLFAQKETAKSILFDDAKYNRYMSTIQAGFIGPSLMKINKAAMNVIVEPLRQIEAGQTLEIPDLFIWLRDIMGKGIAESLYGAHNPITPELYATLWDFEDGVALISQGMDFAARKAIAARENIIAATTDYYAQRHYEHPSVSDIMQKRGVLSQEYGLSPEENARWDMCIIWVGSTNTIPTLFWFFVNIFSRPDFVARIRAEVEACVTVEDSPGGGRVATIDTGSLEKTCPFLAAGFRETLRLYVQNLGLRRVMRDTKLQDPETGREYLLRAGVDIHWQSAVTHALPEVWGDSREDFNPERFVKVPLAEEKKRRGAMIPFGGGKHYCPGRKFAEAENLGLLAVLALGYEVEGVRVPKSEDPPAGLAARQIVWGDLNKGARIKRREGWEDVAWRFTS